jgi:hypothetical protein
LLNRENFISTKEGDSKSMDKDSHSVDYLTKKASEDKPEKCNMIFCSNCNGSGKYFYAGKGVSGCNFCGGFGLIRTEKNCMV